MLIVVVDAVLIVVIVVTAVIVSWWRHTGTPSSAKQVPYQSYSTYSSSLLWRLWDDTSEIQIQLQMAGLLLTATEIYTFDFESENESWSGLSYVMISEWVDVSDPWASAEDNTNIWTWSMGLK